MAIKNSENVPNSLPLKTTKSSICLKNKGEVMDKNTETS